MKRTLFCAVASVLSICWASAPYTAAADDDAQARRDAIVVRALERMNDFDYRSDPETVAAVNRQIRRSQGTPEFMDLLRRFRPDAMDELLQQALLGDDPSAAVEAAEMMLERDQGRRAIRGLLKSPDHSSAVAKVLGLLGNGRSLFILSEVASDAERDFAMRRAAVSGLAKTKSGQKRLVELASGKKLVGDTFLVVGALLSRSDDAAIREAAAKVLPQPASVDAKPLPPVDVLAKQTGDVANGMKLFRSTATCANCHIVNDYGKNVGPDLSEIGDKLSREAMLTAILLPSAGISHNYENFSVLTEDGQVVSGLKTTETADQVVIRTADAIDRKFDTDEIAQLKKSEKSIMPENLHHVFGQKGLIDLVEYMTTLKKKS